MAKFTRFGDDARQVMAFAHREARKLYSSEIGLEHVLIALLQPVFGLYERLTESGYDVAYLVDQVEKYVVQHQQLSGDFIAPKLSSEFMQMHINAIAYAERTGAEFVEPLHIWYAILKKCADRMSSEVQLGDLEQHLLPPGQ